MYPERAYRSPSPMRQPPPIDGRQRRLTQEEWTQAIIDEARKFCEAYPRDPQCHFKEEQR
jgi:hypothetical protein